MDIITTLRAPKLFDIAIADVVFTIGLAYLIHVHVFDDKPFAFSVAYTFALGILAHILFGVPTMLNYYLGLSERPLR